MPIPPRLTDWGDAVFFTERFYADRTPSLESGIRVVAEVASLHGLGFLLVLVGGAVISSWRNATLGGIENLADLSWWVYAVSVGVGLLVIANWLVLSALLHVIIKLRHGDGTFEDTLLVVAWSSPITLIASLFWGAGFLLWIASSQLIMSYDASVIAAAQGARIPGVIGGIISLLWQGHLWPTGLEKRHDVEHEPAVRASAAIVLLGVVALLISGFS